MKKRYAKPEIMFEDFTLSTNIAGDCDTKTDTFGNSDCWLDFSGLKVFLEGMNGCSDIKVTNYGGDGEFNGICYHVPLESNNLFNS